MALVGGHRGWFLVSLQPLEINSGQYSRQLEFLQQIHPYRLRTTDGVAETDHVDGFLTH
jgi:hypothetical protein